MYGGIGQFGRLALALRSAIDLEWAQTIVAAHDLGALGGWSRAALDWVVVNDDPDEFEIRPTADRLPGLLFVPVPRESSKNQLHPDFRSDDRDGEVDRLLALGATRADIGQGSRPGLCFRTPRAMSSAYSDTSP